MSVGRHDKEYFVFNEVLRELERARTKFPKQDIWVTLAALTEEIGELNRAILEHHFEPHKNVSLVDIRKEAVQSITMLQRVLFDCGIDLTNPTEKE